MGRSFAFAPGTFSVTMLAHGGGFFVIFNDSVIHNIATNMPDTLHDGYATLAYSLCSCLVRFELILLPFGVHICLKGVPKYGRQQDIIAVGFVWLARR